jgi:hypothetical protein
MFKVKISPFGGLIPKFGSRLLPPSSATIANNVKLQSGQLKPLRAPELIAEPNKPSPLMTVYLARQNIDTQAWFSWVEDVDVVRAPLPVETESRYYWTGQGNPKFATYTLAVTGGGDNYPALALEIGIPTPQTAPTVTPDASGSGSNVTRFYCYTYFSELGEESAPSPVSALTTGKFDDVWAISGMNEFPANSGVGTASHSAGVTTFTNDSSARHWLRVGDEIVIDDDNVFVTELPSAVAFKVNGNYAAETTWARANNWNTANMKRRLYRTAGSLATFQLVHDDVSTTYNDSLSDSQILGDDLITQGWLPPPIGIKGLTVHPSGALVAFVNNLLCFSVPYQPHAWRLADQLATDYKIVGVATYGTEIGIGTEGNPYVASGVEPASMTLQAVKGVFPCLSKRSVASIGNGFIYSTRHGMAAVGNEGVSLLTDSFFTKDEWEVYNPSSINTALAYGRIYLSYTRKNGSRAMLIMDGDILTSADVLAHKLYTDEASGELYITDDKGIKIWDSKNSYPLIASYQSKDFVSPMPVNIGAAKVDFDIAINEDDLAILLAQIDEIIASNTILMSSGNLHGSINSRAYNALAVNSSDIQETPDLPPSNLITFTLKRNNQIVATRLISNKAAFRLPAGYKDDVFSIQVISQSTIREIRFAETPEALRDI